MAMGSVGFDACAVDVGNGKKNNLDIRPANRGEWTGNDKHFEIIFESHVIEHSLSPVKFVKQCAASQKNVSCLQ